MRMGKLSVPEAAGVVDAALAGGMTLFDHADIYAGGRSEEVFSAAISELGIARSSLILQSKCGIRDGYFDFSREHILQSVEGSLKRLNADYLDVLLLHRPDTLMEPDEVAAAFSELHRAGKVRHFGVSNQHGGQIDLLRAAVEQPLVINQLQLSLAHTPIIDRGFNVDMGNAAAIDRDGGILEYCRLHRITIQPWSPLQFGFFQGVFLDHPDYGKLNEVLRRIAAEQRVAPSAVAIAWLLRHPAGFQPILGSMNPGRIREMARAGEVTLDRAQWYELYRAAGNVLP
jgi:predicted oxidoreductase